MIMGETNRAQSVTTVEAANEMVSCSTLQQQVLDELSASTKPIKALELSKLLEIPKSELNKILYTLMNIGKIKRTTDTPPMWVYDRQSLSVLDSKGCSSLVLHVLEKKGLPMSSRSIAYELKEPKTVVNRILYELERTGKIERLQLSPPMWQRRKSELEDNASPSFDGEQIGKLAFPADAEGNKRQRVESPESRSNPPTSSQGGGGEIMPIRIGIAENCSSREVPRIYYQSCHHTNSQSGDVDPDLSKEIANAVWGKYNSLYPEANASKTVLAGYVLRTVNGTKEGTLKVVALGTGSKILPGDKYSLTGSVVHDCHAEIIARRSLLRWLYKQLDTVDEPQSYATTSQGNTPFELRPFDLWLYCSQAPCGDAAVFSLGDPDPDVVPCFTTRNHGMLRAKSEGCHGGEIFKANGPALSFGDLQLGNRSQCHACSDKLAKRCVIGVQGALLTQLIPPLYLSGVVLGSVFSHAHIARGLCCRSEVALSSFEAKLSPVFSLHHPKIGNCALDMTRSEQVGIKRSKLSLNWALGDVNVEILDATTGRPDNNDPSRVSKKAFFCSFLRLCNYPTTTLITYKKAKAQSFDYQQSKQVWVEAMRNKFGTGWSSKPSEVEDFSNEE
mmetsp:Transcript_22307/g.37316  ORF Transcript_22307/g.37316 Transcript_22307/m.37316 type:complete len:616 (-) Transcript_22307:528-2375(-)